MEFKKVYSKLFAAGFRSIACADHRYLVNADGIVLSLFNSFGPRKDPKEVKKCITKAGYEAVYMRKNNKIRITKFVHRLVADAFMGLDIDDLSMQINHINGCKRDNRVSNLEVCTKSQNRKHAEKMGLIKRKKSFTQNELKWILEAQNNGLKTAKP